MKKFNNKENEKVSIIDGRVVWLSRSIAVCNMVIATPLLGDNKEPKVLIVKRGDNVTHSGLWCLPCGYLDYDETLKDAAIRETFEETGYDVDPNAVIRYDVHDDPNAFNQNITVHFKTQSTFLDSEDFKAFNEYLKNNLRDSDSIKGEVEDIKLISYDEVDHHDFAFNHGLRIKKELKTHLKDWQREKDDSTLIHLLTNKVIQFKEEGRTQEISALYDVMSVIDGLVSVNEINEKNKRLI